MLSSISSVSSFQGPSYPGFRSRVADNRGNPIEPSSPLRSSRPKQQKATPSLESYTTETNSQQL